VLFLPKGLAGIVDIVRDRAAARRAAAPKAPKPAAPPLDPMKSEAGAGS
jgi:hypothetical protein